MWESHPIAIWILPNLHQRKRKRKEILRGRVKTASIVWRKSKKEEIKITLRGKKRNATSDREGRRSQAPEKQEKTHKDQD